MSATETDRAIGERIRLARQQACITQDELAELICGATVDDIRAYERGERRPSAARLVQIVDKLGVPLSFLFRPPEWEN